MRYCVIPARAGSKGLSGKNRILFDYTVGIIPAGENVIVTTDDPEIAEMATGYHIIDRSPELCADDTPIKAVLLDVVEKTKMKKTDIVILLYLTYPGRTWDDVLKALLQFSKYKNSLLCRMPVRTHPYMCIYSDGSQVLNHTCYQRQQYPDVYEISHYVGIFKVGEIENLNNNLYNETTDYYDIQRVHDIDTEEDLNAFLGR